MKLAISQPILLGAWGNNNQFVAALSEAMRARGDSVVYDLLDRDVDVILITDPRPRNPALSFTPGQVLRYILSRNPTALVLHRINDCDERMRTRGMNFRLRNANAIADHTVFIASWLKALDVWQAAAPATVILNGADTRIFNADHYEPWDGVEPLRLVTHHWGGNRMKGFDVYERLDALSAAPEWRQRLRFTYIGNLPSGFKFSQARYVPPIFGPRLASELRSHHVYLTASINEPAGMHHIEGALCGLPLIYRDSGALPEYCEGFGEVISGADDFEAALKSMMKNYFQWLEYIASYSHTANRMCQAYMALFDDLVGRRDEILAKRRLWRHPFAFALNQIPW